MPIEIRLADRADVPGVEALARKLLPDPRDELDLGGLFDLPTALLELHILLIAADENDTVVGYAFFAPHFDDVLNIPDLRTAVLQHICVAAEHRNDQLATALEQEGIALARDAGYEQAVATTTADGAGLLRALGWDVRDQGALAWPSPVAGHKFTLSDTSRPLAAKNLTRNVQ
ncbi:GNAT family N-acetyltransferase [Curtobacterium sp. Csp1]|uniref:GNAT family N-acetyltransferase n=1 Tax=Curtobacterium sp. Csp1 TaxID=2495429 RepID=UPI00159A86AA|nr:GNAT family N-acetyltransferase [Curtobacterium sp. Csp1]QKS18877.1 GNAT family N-acetyltransferase [Curtobacterium sp. Csp1]